MKQPGRASIPKLGDDRDYGQHLRDHWPVVFNLGVIVLIEWWISRELNYGVTPLALLGLERQAAEFWWTVLLSGLFVLGLVRYVTGSAHRLPLVTWVSMVIFTLGIMLDVVELAMSLVDPSISPRRASPNGPTPTEIGVALLWDGALIWTSNIVLFTLWYWLLDGGGHECRAEGTWERRDFLFPQQQTDQPLPDFPDWHPQYLDYLYLAFCTSTALSPADTLTLTWRGKIFQMLQATMSLIVIALIIARAINILSSSASGP